jgi:hypothetical protein
LEEDSWDPLVLRWAAERIESGLHHSVSVAEVLDLCIQKRVGDWTRGDHMRVGSCLTRAGWIRRKVRIPGSGGQSGWRYFVPTPNEVGTGGNVRK